jgi:predicted RNase H-like HicB family nuclease
MTAAMSSYLVVIEMDRGSWGAYCPDLPGVGVVGSSRQEVEELIGEAVDLHIEALRQSGDQVPEPSTSAGYVRVG